MKKKVTYLSAADYILATCFTALALLVILHTYFSVDLKITLFLQQFSSGPIFFLMNLISNVGNVPYMEILIALCTIALIYMGYRLEAAVSVFSVGISAGIGWLIKLIVSRPRPTENLVEVFANLSDKSFPSNHVLTYTVFFGFILYLSMYTIKNRIWKTVLTFSSLVLLLTIGISRIYLGVHWASDVLGGYLIGLLLLSLTIKFYRSHHTNKK